MSTKKFQGNIQVKNNAQVDGKITQPNETASRALQINGSGEMESSSVTSTELGHLSGVTSDIQTQIDAKIASSEKGAANGVATLDGSSKLPSAQLPVSAMEYKGAHNVSTNSPALVDGSGTNGDMYRISIGGSRDYGSGSQTFAAGDAIIYNGSIWEKIPGEDIIQSVAGKTGVVTLDTDDVSEATNLYYTQGRFDSAFTAKDTDALSEGVANLYYTQTRFDSAFTAKSTTDLSEGTNLYYTQARFDSAFTAKDTDGLSEGSTNLYYTDARFDSSFSGKDSADLNHTQADAADWTVATGASIAAHLDELGDRVATVEGAADSDENVKCSANDTTAGYLEDKITVSTGTNASSAIEKTTLNDGGDEDVQIQIDLDRIRKHSTGDILETSFAAANNQAVAANVTGLAFANGTVRSFKVHGSIVSDATADLFEAFELEGIQRGSDWVMSDSRTGDESEVVFTITTAGQVQYTSGNYAGFSSLTIKFRAITTSV